MVTYGAIDEHRGRKDMKFPDMCPYCGHGFVDDGDKVSEITLARHPNNRWSCYNDECWEKAERNKEYEFDLYIKYMTEDEAMKELEEL